MSHLARNLPLAEVYTCLRAAFLMSSSEPSQFMREINTKKARQIQKMQPGSSTSPTVRQKNLAHRICRPIYHKQPIEE